MSHGGVGGGQKSAKKVSHIIWMAPNNWHSEMLSKRNNFNKDEKVEFQKFGGSTIA